jgi:hypothetical protein
MADEQETAEITVIKLIKRVIILLNIHMLHFADGDLSLRVIL